MGTKQRIGEGDSRIMRRGSVLALVAVAIAVASAAGCAAAKKGPPPARNGVLLVGDSFADNVSAPLASELAARQRPFQSAAVPGCSVVRGVTTDDNGVTLQGAEACDRAVWPLHQDKIDTFAPSVVLWLAAQEIWGRRVDGGWYIPGEFGPESAVNGAEGDAKLLELIEAKRAQLTSRGAKLVIVTMPPPVGPTEGLAPRFVHLNDLLRRFVLANGRTTAMIDLAQVACPSAAQAPCPEFVDGVQLRASVDGAHFTPQGAAWAARRISAAL
jgi:hypothetical protein